MRRWPLGITVLALAGCATTSRPRAGSSTPAPLTRQQVVGRVLRSSVRVHVSIGPTLARTASGVVVGQSAPGAPVESLVVTNAHVVEAQGLSGAPRFEVLVDGPRGAVAHPATLVAQGTVPGVDLALLRVSGVRLTPAVLADNTEVALGSDVLVVGAPYGHGLSLSRGMLSQIQQLQGEPGLLKTDAPIGYGASGGGIFDLHTGHLLGVIEGYRTAQVEIPGDDGGAGWRFDVPMPGETFGSSVAKVRRFIAAHPALVTGQVARR